jgi:hypothetical protein
MARTWLEITVELVSGGTRDDFWPRPGRTFVAARSHSFEQLAEAIDEAFGRWDLNHLHEFVLSDGTCLGTPDPEWDEGRVISHARRTKLSRLGLGVRFAYVFDLGDYWTHLCTVGAERVDPVTAVGSIPPRPTVIFGWGDLPDQHGRLWPGDDTQSPVPEDPQGSDLPPILPGWERTGRPESAPNNVLRLRPRSS